LGSAEKKYESCKSNEVYHNFGTLGGGVWTGNPEFDFEVKGVDLGKVSQRRFLKDEVKGIESDISQLGQQIWKNLQETKAKIERREERARFKK
jgi:hypothetical protein